MIYARKCKRCEELFDIAINYELCPNCRRKEKEEKKEGEDERNK